MFITFLEGSGDFPGGLLIRIWVFPPLCKRFHKPTAVQPPKKNLFIMYTMQGTAKVLIDIKIHSLILKTIHTFSPNKYMKSESVSFSVVSNSLRPHGLYPARLLCPWDSLGKNTGVDYHSPPQRIFATQGLNPDLLHCKWILHRLTFREALLQGRGTSNRNRG